MSLRSVDLLTSWPKGMRAAAQAARPGRVGVPALRFRPYPLASVMLDSMVLAMMRRPEIASGGIGALVGDAERAVDVLERRGLLDDPRGLFPEPPLATTIRRSTRRYNGFSFGHMSWPSGFVPPDGLPGREQWIADPANSVAHYYVLRHADRARPWVIVLHPYMTGEARDLFAFGSLNLHLALGVNVIHPVMPLHGPRRRTSAPAYPGPDAVINLIGCMQAMWDVRTLLALARSRGATRIGVHGYSLGGHHAGVLAGLEPDLGCVISGAAPMDFIELIGLHVDAPGIGQLGRGAPALLGRLVSPLNLAPLVPRERLFVYGAVGDRFAPPEHAARLWRHWGQPRIRWLQHGHSTAFGSPQATAFVMGALRRSGVAVPLRGRRRAVSRRGGSLPAAS